MSRPWDEETKVLELVIKQLDYMAMFDVDNVRLSDKLKLEMTYRIEHLAHVLRASLRLPCQVLQEDREICSYPATWWDAVKARLGWRHRKITHRLNEWLVFPNIPLPEPSLGTMRVYVQPRFHGPYFGDEDDDQD